MGRGGEINYKGRDGRGGRDRVRVRVGDWVEERVRDYYSYRYTHNTNYCGDLI